MDLPQSLISGRQRPPLKNRCKFLLSAAYAGAGKFWKQLEKEKNELKKKNKQFSHSADSQRPSVEVADFD